ncbi:DUF2207 family protein [Amycolatopsis saalfeldensis]|uniref:Predicted membrane protein n=1 Tax=Amycolatopsis saalfeldensis TaxID=394193 RepID=A0A1H8YKD9_9PSEU|nr:DUF2207 domain-containing protein [Amycolatopsis saalfeldensis]SEP52563.1 Predicted membrane protein [Amycolatopsis saalfeldensis]
MRRTVFLVVPALLLALTPAAFAQDLPALPQSAEVTLKVQRDGSLSVTEAVSVPEGTSMTRRIALRAPADDNQDRLLTVRDLSIEGAGSSETSADAVTLDLRGGTSIVQYTVDGAVGAGRGVERVTWDLAGGWDTRLELVRATFAAPSVPDALSCLAGPPGTVSPCGAAQIDHSGLTRVSVPNLAAGQRVELTAELPGGTVPVTERLVPAKTVAGAISASAPVWWAWGAFAVLLLAALALVGFLRRRDAAPAVPLPVDLLSDGQFSSPDGVLPGHVGPLLTGRAGAVDLAATVLDLCVRNYIWVSEDGPRDWVLVRRNPPDEQLGRFERAVYEAVLPGESVKVSSLHSFQTGVLADVVRRRWLSRRGAKLSRAGARLSLYGVFLTVLLTFTVGYAQLGLVVIACGVVLSLGARLLPARTTSGLLLRRRLLGLRARLAAPDPARLTAADRELLFSRALPYALALGEADQWVAAFAAPGRSPQAYWYGTAAEGPAAVAATSGFATALVAAFASADHEVRGIRPDAPRDPAPA